MDVFARSNSTYLLLLLCSGLHLNFAVRLDLEAEESSTLEAEESSIEQQLADEVMAAIPAAWERFIVRDTRPIFFGLAKKKKELGRGSYGRVTSVSLPSCPGLHLALKVVERGPMDDAEIATEVAVMSLQNTRLLSALAYGMGNPEKGNPNKFYMLMPMADTDMFNVDAYRGRHLLGGHLQGLVFLHDLLYGLSALHAKQIVHRDMKPENIFLFCPDDSIKPCNAVLADFGLACQLPGGSGKQIQRCRSGDLAGTPLYMLPELGNALEEGREFPGSLGYWKANDVYGAALSVQAVMEDISEDISGIWAPDSLTADFRTLLLEMKHRMRTAEQAYFKVTDMLQPYKSLINLDKAVVHMEGGCTKTLQDLRIHSKLPSLH